MAEVSRRAARNSSKGALPNAVFVAAGVEMLPCELAGLADLVTVRFPWGSLLRGTLGLDDRAAIAIARLVSALGALEMTVSITDRDAVGDGRPTGPFGEPDIERIRRTYVDLGFRLCDVRSLSRADLRAIDSSWARRLFVDRDRVAWVLRLEFPGRRLVSPGPAQTVKTRLATLEDDPGHHGSAASESAHARFVAARPAGSPVPVACGPASPGFPLTA